MNNYPKTLHIVVTEDDIKNGRRHGAFSCPIALAGLRLCDELGIVTDKSGSEVGVSPGRVALYGSDDMAEYIAPDAALDFILRFDRGAVVEPFEFTATLSEVTLDESGFGVID